MKPSQRMDLKQSAEYKRNPDFPVFNSVKHTVTDSRQQSLALADLTLKKEVLKPPGTFMSFVVMSVASHKTIDCLDLKYIETRITSP